VHRVNTQLPATPGLVFAKLHGALSVLSVMISMVRLILSRYYPKEKKMRLDVALSLFRMDFEYEIDSPRRLPIRGSPMLVTLW
jgi:hypothetical protein